MAKEKSREKSKNESDEEVAIVSKQSKLLRSFRSLFSAQYILLSVFIILIAFLAPIAFEYKIKPLLSNSGCQPCNCKSNHELEKLILEQDEEIAQLEKRLADSRAEFKKYSDDDLFGVFGVEYVDHVVMDLEFEDIFEDYFKNHSLDFSERDDDPEVIQEWIELYTPYLNGSKRINSNLTYVQFSDPIRNFGVFAATDLQPGTLIGEYTGELTLTDNTDYVWTYPVDIIESEDEEFTFGLDAKNKGNTMRFVNSAPAHACNVEVRYVPYKNLWHVLYVTDEYVPKDVQLFVSYGKEYWTERGETHALI